VTRGKENVTKVIGVTDEQRRSFNNKYVESATKICHIRKDRLAPLWMNFFPPV